MKKFMNRHQNEEGAYRYRMTIELEITAEVSL
jgi:hypothetical protein